MTIESIYKISTLSLKATAGVLLALGMVGCKEFRGKIQVQQAFSAKVVKGKNVIPVGEHSVKVDFPEKGKARIEVSLPGKNTNPRFYIKLPRGSGLNQYNGPVSIKSEESGQPFDITGSIQTDIYNSPTIRDFEYCTYTDRETICTRNEDGVRTCITNEVTKSGEKRVEYYNSTETQTIDLQLASTAGAHLADLDGRYTDTDKIYTYVGRCHGNRWGDHDDFGRGGHHGHGGW